MDGAEESEVDIEPFASDYSLKLTQLQTIEH
jgi:hypothetical protein